MTVYYVDATTGSDSDAGTSEELAWQTLTKVSNEFGASTFSVGDQILFKRGETWTVTSSANRLDVDTCNGAIGNHIYLGVYGSGNKPRFDANGNGTRVINVSSVSYITLENLDTRNNDDASCFAISYSDHIDVLFCDVSGVTATTWAAGLRINYGSEYIWVEGCTIDTIDGEGVYIGRPDVADASRRVVLKDCVISNCNAEGLELKDATRSCFIYNCTFIDNGSNMGAADDWTQVSVGGKHHVFYQCKFEGTRVSNQCAVYLGRYQGGVFTDSGRYCTVERCLFKNCTGSYGAVYADGDNNRVINCTFVGCSYDIYGLADSAGGYEIKNNIFSGETSYPVYLTTDESYYDFDHNDYGDGASNVWYYSGAARDFSYVQGLGQEANGITTTPAFEETTNYTLSSGSGCRNAGDAAETVYDWEDEYGASGAVDMGWREYGLTLPHRVFSTLFESTTFERFTGYSGVARVALPTKAGLGSLWVSITDTADRYAYRSGLGNLKHFYASFYVNADGLAMANGDLFSIFEGRTSGNVDVVVVQLNYDGANIRVRAGVIEDSDAWTYTGYFNLGSGWNLVEIFWMAGPDTSVNDGELVLWLDDVEEAHVTSLNNHDDLVDRFYVGAPDDLDAGTSGSLYVDVLRADWVREMGEYGEVHEPPGEEVGVMVDAIFCSRGRWGDWVTG